MSFNLEQVRKAYQDPAISKIVELTKRIAKIEADNIEIESDDLTGFGDVDHSKVLYNDYWNFIKNYANYDHYVTFDGVDDYIDCGNQSSLWSRPLDKFSFSFWLYPTNISGTDRDILRHGNVGTGHRFISDISSGSLTRLQIRNAADTVTSIASATGILNNTWNHVLCTYDNSLGSDNLKIYLNSILGSTTGNLTENINCSANLFLSGLSTDFQGRMRDFRWWTSKALTETETKYVMDNILLAPTPNYWLPLYAVQTGNPIDKISGTLQGSLTNGAVFRDRAGPFICFEPDYSKFRLDLRFNMLGPILEDYSGFSNNVIVIGEPCPTTGSDVFYRGGSKKNTGWSVKQAEHIYLQGNNDGAFQMINHQSWIFRLNFRSFNDLDPITGGSRSQTLVEKFDDSDDKYFIRVGNDGQIKAGFMDGGVESKARTTTNIVTNRDYEIVITYDAGSDTIVFYVNGVVQPQSSTIESFDSSTGDTNLHFLASVDPESSYGYCDLNYIDLIRYYDDMILTQTQVNNHYRNKFTISNIDEGDIAITDACVMPYIDESESFTDLSFTETSFTAGA